MTTAGLGDSLTPNARDDVLGALCKSARAQLVELGQSVTGRPILAARFPATGKGTARRVLCVANIHGVEFISGAVALGFAHRLAEDSDSFGMLRERAEVWVAPCINPDGYALTYNQDGHGRVAQLRTNAHGVDLNRNFPRPHGAPVSAMPFSGSSTPGDATYRGPSPLSEPETQAVDKLLAEQRFHAVASLHSFMGTLIPARVQTKPQYKTYAALCDAFSYGQTRWRYRRLASLHLDAFTGELEDHAHHAHDAWAVCVESFPVSHSLTQHLWAPSTFWRFNPRSPERYVANDAPALAAYFLTALDQPPPSQL